MAGTLEALIGRVISPRARTVQAALGELRRKLPTARRPGFLPMHDDQDDLSGLQPLVELELTRRGIPLVSPLPLSVPRPRPLFTPVLTIRLRAIRTANDDGSQAATIGGDDIATIVAALNKFYAPLGVAFVFDKAADLETIHSTLLNLDGDVDPASLANPKDKPPQVVNNAKNDAERYRVASQRIGKLVAFFSYGTGFYWNEAAQKWIVGSRGGGFSSGGTPYVALVHTACSPNFVAHEIGHYLHQGHTHGWLPATPAAAAQEIKKWVDSGWLSKANGAELFDADRAWVTDTPPDPGPTVFEAQFADACLPDQKVVSVDVTFQDATSQTYTLAPDRGNLMSYFKECPAIPHHFSRQQLKRMRVGIEHGNRSHLTTEQPWRPPDAVLTCQSNGRLDAWITAGDACLYHKLWTTANIGPGKLWEPLGGYLDGPVAVATRDPSRFDLVARGIGGNVLYKLYSDATGWVPSATTWRDLGGAVTGRPAAVAWGPGRLDIVARGQDGGVWHKAWTEAGGWFPSEQGWSALGGQITDGPVIVSRGADRLDIVARGQAGDVLHKAWRGAGQGWSPTGQAWRSLGGQIRGAPALIATAPDRLDLAVRGMDGGVWHKSWTAAGGWSPSEAGWVSLGGQITDSPALAGRGHLGLLLAARGAQGAVVTRTVSKTSPTAGQWTSLGGRTVGSPLIRVVDTQRHHFFARGIDGEVLHKSWGAAIGMTPKGDAWATDTQVIHY